MYPASPARSIDRLLAVVGHGVGNERVRERFEVRVGCQPQVDALLGATHRHAVKLGRRRRRDVDARVAIELEIQGETIAGEHSPGRILHVDERHTRVRGIEVHRHRQAQRKPLALCGDDGAMAGVAAKPEIEVTVLVRVAHVERAGMACRRLEHHTRWVWSKSASRISSR